VLLAIVSVAGFLVLVHFSGINPLLLFISFPMLGQIWLGQVDVLVAIGLAMFLFSKNPYWRGVGMIIALSKPQLTAFPLLICLFLDSPRAIMKIMLAPVLVLLVSMFSFGWNWWGQWLENGVNGLPVHVWRLASLDVWRFGVFLAPIPLFFQEKRKRLVSGLLVSALGTPFYGVYSYVLFLLFDVKWWSVLLSYLWLGAYVFWQESAMRLAWILPLGMLFDLVYIELMDRKTTESKRP
jgi:hypothetical protein